MNVSRIFHKHIFALWVVPLTDKIYPFSEMQSTLLRLNAAPSNAAFCMQFIVIGIPIVLQCFSRLSLIVPRAPTKLGITVALKFHSFCSCNLKSLHCLIFSNSFVLVLWSPDTTRSLILQSFFSLSLSQYSHKKSSDLFLLLFFGIFYNHFLLTETMSVQYV